MLHLHVGVFSIEIQKICFCVCETLKKIRAPDRIFFQVSHDAKTSHDVNYYFACIYCRGIFKLLFLPVYR